MDNILLELSRHSNRSRYKLDTPNTVSVNMVDLSNLLSYLSMCYELTPKITTAQKWRVTLWDNDNKRWVTSIRTYYTKKLITDSDLYPIPGKRKWVKLLSNI